MMTITNNQFTVECDGTVMFAYSPNILTIKRVISTLNGVIVSVNSLDTSESVTFELLFGGVGNMLRVDVSRALRIFSGQNIEIVITGGGISSTITPYVINGSREPLEEFGGKYAIRCWDVYKELKIPVLYYENTTAYVRIGDVNVVVQELTTDNISGYELSNISIKGIRNEGKPLEVYALGEVFSGEAWASEERWEFNVIPSCIPRNPIYIRWTDKQGLTWYWMFSVESTSVETKELVKHGRMPDTAVDEGVINTFDTSIIKTIEKRVKIVATGITNDEYRVVKTLATATIVDALDFDSDVWYRIRITNGRYEDVKGNYKDVEFEVEFAPEQTQIG